MVKEMALNKNKVSIEENHYNNKLNQYDNRATTISHHTIYSRIPFLCK